MKLFEKLFKKKQNLTDNEKTKSEDEKFTNDLSKRIMANLIIAESQFYTMEYKIANFNSLSDKEVEHLYDNISQMKQSIQTYKDFSVQYEFPKCVKKADEILSRLENIKDSFNRKLTGIIY